MSATSLATEASVILQRRDLERMGGGAPQTGPDLPDPIFHAGHVKEFRKAAEKLGKERFLLGEDVQCYVDEAEASDVLR